LSCQLTRHSCVVKANKNDLTGLSRRALLARRRRFASRLGDVEQVLTGTLVEQTRRCGKSGCRCLQGQPHGPYTYFVPKTAGRGRMRYVPANLVAAVRARVAGGGQVEAVLAEISAINVELLARRELT
jgi:hypothetical protein